MEQGKVMETQLIKGQYQILQKLSEGGFGITYLAEDHHRPSGRRCVLKQLKPASTNKNQFQLIQDRFRQEATILENLGDGHCQIPELYGYFEEAGLFYIAQEWIEGKTLAHMGQSQRIDEQTVLTLLRQVLPVLDYVHGKGIIHRDLKPANLICRHVDALPVLIDFGAVKEVMGTQFDPEGHPKSSIMIGTPGYCSPEQAAGYPTYASDLYSLGMTMIVMLTQKSPIVLNPNPSVVDTTWHQYAPGMSQSLKQVLDRSIQFHPRDRYASAQMMLSDLPSAHSLSFVTGFTEPLTSHRSESPSPETTKTSHQNSHPSFLLPFLIGIGVSALAALGVWVFRGDAPRSPVVTSSPVTGTDSQRPPMRPPNGQRPEAPTLEQGAEREVSSSESERETQSSPSTSEAERIVGLWETEEVRLSNVLPVKFVAQYRKDGSYETSTLYGANQNGFYGQNGITDASGSWIYSEGTLTETPIFGAATKSSIEWIDNDTVKVTILSSPLVGFAGTSFRAYRRPG